MGTNFYWYAPEHSPCPHCGRADEAERLHVGKSSAGWCFGLHVIPDNGIHGLDDWRKRFEIPGSVIRNEYGETIAPDAMLATITDRRGVGWDAKDRAWNWALGGYRDEAEFHRRNYSQRGPHGLLRAQVSAHCIGHGDGTFDLIPGDFS